MQSFSIPALPDIRSPTRRRGTAQAPEIPAADSIFGKIVIFAPYGNKRGIHNRDFEPLRRLVALQRRADVRLLRHGGQPHRLRIDRGTCRRRRLEPAGKARRESRRRPRKSRNRAVRPPSALHLYRTPYAAGRNDIGDTTPFEVEIRIAYGGRRLRAEKRLINQWSGASIEMRVDSEAR